MFVGGNKGKNHANHFILTRKRAGRKEKAAADGFPPEGHALLKPVFLGCLHRSGKVGRCHRGTFVTSYQKDNQKKIPTKLQNTTFGMPTIGRLTEPHWEGKSKRRRNPRMS